MAAFSLPFTKAGAPSAQDFLIIESIRDGIVMLKGGRGLRAVLMVSSLNFALESEEEQDATIFQYETFLNSLDFPMEFVVHSRRLNISPYIAILEGRRKEETNELLQIQIGEYIEFVRTFVDMQQIVSKTFYAIVPFQPSMVARRKSLFPGLPGFGSKGGSAANSEADNEFAQFKNQLVQRVDSVSLGLRRFGLRVAQLNTEELVELFYGLYNPTESQKVVEKKPE